MAVQTITIPPLDPNGFTGPVRVMSGIARTDTIVVNTFYGPSGALEFARWIYVGTSGNLSYMKWDGTSQTLVGLAAGIWHPIYSIMVNSVGTTATDLVWGS